MGRLLGAAMEGIALALVGLSPWSFGASEPVFEFILSCGVAGLLLLAAARLAVTGTYTTLKKCPVTSCLAALFLFGIFQLVPLPQGVLRFLSPATVQTYQDYLPAEPETLRGEEIGAGTTSAGSTLSLYPGATRRELVRLLAALVLFLVLRNTLDLPGSLRRLAWLALVNGTLLALFGLIQRLSSHDEHVIYGSVTIQGFAFGPFIYRNYFACYMNLCFGMGLGLLLSHWQETYGRDWSVDGADLNAAGPQSVVGQLSNLPEIAGQVGNLRHNFSASSMDIEQGDPKAPPSLFAWFLSGKNKLALWIVSALVLMVGASVFCQSRGGVLVLVATAGIFLLPRLRNLRGPQVVVVLCAGLVILGLLSWCGFAWSKARLQSVWNGTILDGDNNGRSIIWLRVLPLLAEFPLWGTGYGTFPYMEQPFQERESYHVVDWAHNDYLQVLIEGGVPCLVLVLLGIFLAVRKGLQGIALRRGSPAQGLYVGALFALATFFIHCLFDFPLHLPAIWVLVVVLAANLVAAADPDSAGSSAGPGRFRSVGASVLGCMAAGALAFVLLAEGHAAYLAQKLLLAGAGAGPPLPREDRLACLRQAAAHEPGSARLQVLLADACLEIYLESCRRAGSESEQRYLVPAIRHYIMARDRCPLLAKPHVRIAANYSLLGRADPRSAYLDRACRLVPYDAELWYLRGIQEIADRQKTDACRSWRRSLELSDRHLSAILGQSRGHFTAQEILDRILPDNPDILLSGARQLFGGNLRSEDARPFLLKALRLLAERSPLTPADLHRKGVVFEALGSLDEAAAAYRLALASSAAPNEWHWDLARVCWEGKHLTEAERELRTLLNAQPGHEQGRALLDRIVEKMP